MIFSTKTHRNFSTFLAVLHIKNILNSIPEPPYLTVLKVSLQVLRFQQDAADKKHQLYKVNLNYYIIIICNTNLC